MASGGNGKQKRTVSYITGGMETKDKPGKKVTPKAYTKKGMNREVRITSFDYSIFNVYN